MFLTLWASAGEPISKPASSVCTQKCVKLAISCVQMAQGTA